MSLLRSIGPLAAASFATGTQTYVFAGLLGEMASELGVGIGAAGQLATAYAVTFALAAPLLGGLLAARERRGVLLAALLAVAGLNLAAALAMGFAALLGLRIAVGVAAAAVTPIASAAAIALVPPAQRGRALAMVSSGMVVAFILGIPLGSAIGGLFGWRATFLFAAVLALGAALLVRLALPVVQPGPRSPGALADALGSPSVRACLLITLLGFTATFTVVAYIGPVVTALTGATGAGVGAFQACIGVGALIGVPLGGVLADRGLGRPALAGAFAAMVATLAAYTLLLGGVAAGVAPALLGLVILVGAAALFLVMPIIQARLVEAVPAAAPLLLGLNGSMVFLGQGAGALIGGLVTDHAGTPAIGLVGAAIAVIGLGLALAARRRPRLVPAGG
ncbi:MAG: MFS transporter [Acetobacteraceae bacterium]|nr:MFS transporter [Acetobacteraceae bacterium]